MFIGHFAMGFGAKRFAPQLSLGVLFLACQLADLIWPNLVLLGIETLKIQPGATAITPLDFSSYPYSHSLFGLLLWGAIFAAFYISLSHAGARAAVVIVALVLSHWVLDVLTHRPDMPISFGEARKIGIGLWNYPIIAVSLELSLLGVGVWMYNRSTKPLDRKGSLGLWMLVTFLVVVYLANVFGPPPPSTTAVAWSAQAMWLLVVWGYWIDRHRAAPTTALPRASERS
jgi:hypothetical protein